MKICLFMHIEHDKQVFWSFGCLGSCRHLGKRGCSGLDKRGEEISEVVIISSLDCGTDFKPSILIASGAEWKRIVREKILIGMLWVCSGWNDSE